MISAKNVYSGYIRYLLTVLAFFIIKGSVEVKAQQHPPRPIRIDVTSQYLRFGAFYHGAVGGTVIIDPSGSRSATGDIVLLGLGFPFSPALFEVHAHPGTVISILNSPDVTLLGTPSGSMILHIGASIPASPFVSTVQFNVAIPLYIGGTLTVGNSVSNPPGSYSGTFEITLVQE